jgi:pantoate--beta-alanine ligase
VNIISQIERVTAQIREWKRHNLSIAFVPTMGTLHAGHLALVERAKQCADKVVISIFVNPTQFDRATDLAAYPRTEQEDQQKLQAAGVDLLFLPNNEIMYPNVDNTCRIQVPAIANILEGASRQGHFSGVATIVAKLFNLVQADYAIFGEKDFQQLMLIRQMVRDLNFAIKIIAVPTFREKSGLAMSSRNGYLSTTEREQAAFLYQCLQSLRDKIIAGERNYAALQKWAFQQLVEQKFQPDYIEIRQQLDLQTPTQAQTQLVILVAAQLGKARLIDNLSLTVIS